MSWFKYGTPAKRSHRKGVWLRVRKIPDDILKKVNKDVRFHERIEWCVVQEIQDDGYVLLEFWCCSLFALARAKKHGTMRYTVVNIRVKENPEWICEGDLGRGYVEPTCKTIPRKHWFLPDKATGGVYCVICGSNREGLCHGDPSEALPEGA